jgi:toxin ParE1/3/4
MARFRLSAPAKADIRNILAKSLERWGADRRSRYAALLTAALRSLAAHPAGPTSRTRDDLLPGVRSFHVRHVRGEHAVGQPAHVIYYRTVPPDLIEVVRVLHERMDPSRHLDEPSATRKPPRSRRR